MATIEIHDLDWKTIHFNKHCDKTYKNIYLTSPILYTTQVQPVQLSPVAGLAFFFFMHSHLVLIDLDQRDREV